MKCPQCGNEGRIRLEPDAINHFFEYTNNRRVKAVCLKCKEVFKTRHESRRIKYGLNQMTPVTLYISEIQDIGGRDRVFKIHRNKPKAISAVRRFMLSTGNECSWSKSNEKTDHWNSSIGHNVYIHKTTALNAKRRRILAGKAWRGRPDRAFRDDAPKCHFIDLESKTICRTVIGFSKETNSWVHLAKSPLCNHEPQPRRNSKQENNIV